MIRALLALVLGAEMVYPDLAAASVRASLADPSNHPKETT